jgi:polysaccharide deacetylase family protein (PEP-CTERM system associated)
VNSVANRTARPIVALSFDVECYYQIVFKDFVGKAVEPTDEVLVNTMWLLDTLKVSGSRATFFFLGNVAEKYPELVSRAVEEGHEIGVHGDIHDYVSDMDADQFKVEIGTGMQKIANAGANRIVGHRATAFSINSGNLWALDVLKDLGLTYDSSIFPFNGGRYGIPSWSRQPEKTSAGIFEIPLSVVKFAGRKLPSMGGGYVRYFPFAFTRWCAKQLHREGLTPICYFHPYEFELSKPRFEEIDIVSLSPAKRRKLSRFNMMQSLGRGAAMRRKLKNILRHYQTVPVGALVTEPTASQA